MKNFIYLSILLLTGTIYGQRTISMTLLDEKLNFIQQKDVSGITFTLCGPDTVTMIYKETFGPSNFQITDGIVNLKTGTGMAATPYADAINKYYNDLPENKKPTSESYLIVKIEVKRNTGKAIQFMDEIKFNSPEPLIKGDDKNKVSVSSENIALTRKETDKNISTLYISPLSVILNNSGTTEKTQVDRLGIDILGTRDRSVLRGGYGIYYDRAFLPEVINTINGSGLNISQGPEHQSIFNVDGITMNYLNRSFNFATPSGFKYFDKTTNKELKIDLDALSIFRQASPVNKSATISVDGFTVGSGPEFTPPNLINSARLTPDKLNFTKDGDVYFSTGFEGLEFYNYNNKLLLNRWAIGNSTFSGWDSDFANPNGFKTRLSTTGFLNLKLNDKTDVYIDGKSLNFKNELLRGSFGGDGFGLQKLNNALIWDFNATRGLFRPDNDREFFFNRDFLNFSDIPSKRNTKLFPNGVGIHFEDKVITQIGANTAGNPVINIFRNIGTPAHSGALNSDGFFDQGWYNPSGKTIFRITSVAETNGSHPYLYGALDGGLPLVGMLIDKNTKLGNMFANGSKNFIMDHPLDKEKSIVYACIEGPEVAVYCRGVNELQEGSIFVSFPDHFNFVCSLDNLTVQLTPRSAKSKGLAVTSITEKGFKVEELMDGKGNYKFFWEAKGIRKGFESFQVIRAKSELMPMPFGDATLDKK